MTVIEARDSLPDDYNTFIDNYVFAPKAEQIQYQEARNAMLRLASLLKRQPNDYL